MKSFKFSEQEIELLIAMYEDELKEVTDYSDRLRETLKKLKNESESSEVGAPVREGKKRGRKPGQKNAKKPVTGKKRGRKPKSAATAVTPTQPEASAAPKVVKEKKAGRKKTRKVKKVKRAPVTKKAEITPAKEEKGSTEPMI